MKISFKGLYEKYGALLKYGGCIDFYRNNCYDLRTEDGELLARNEEDFDVISANRSSVVLESTETGKKLYLTVEEFGFAAFNEMERIVEIAMSDD